MINKDKQIREIKGERNEFTILWVISVIIALLLSFWVGHLKNNESKLEQQLESCQEWNDVLVSFLDSDYSDKEKVCEKYNLTEKFCRDSVVFYSKEVPVWTLKAECKYPLTEFYHYSEKNYTNYEEYLEGEQRVIDFENCEVIESPDFLKYDRTYSESMNMACVVGEGCYEGLP